MGRPPNPCRNYLVKELVRVKLGDPCNNHRAIIVANWTFDGEHLARIGEAHIGKRFVNLPWVSQRLRDRDALEISLMGRNVVVHG